MSNPLVTAVVEELGKLHLENRFHFDRLVNAVRQQGPHVHALADALQALAAAADKLPEEKPAEHEPPAHTD